MPSSASHSLRLPEAAGGVAFGDVPAGRSWVPFWFDCAASAFVRSVVRSALMVSLMSIHQRVCKRAGSARGDGGVGRCCFGRRIDIATAERRGECDLLVAPV